MTAIIWVFAVISVLLVLAIGAILLGLINFAGFLENLYSKGDDE